MINWILAFLGIAIYFIGRYAKRSNKEKPFSFPFWCKDNWPEMVTSVLAVIALLIIFLSKESEFDFTPFLGKVPGVVSLPMNMVLSLFVGYGNSALFYRIFKEKVTKE
jgi:hypothetical protein